MTDEETAPTYSFWIRSDGRARYLRERTWTLFVQEQGKEVLRLRLTAKELEDLMLVAGRGLRLECEELT